METYYSKALELIKLGKSFVTVTLVDFKGSVPQEKGSSMIVTEDSEETPLVGTIGGGAVELFSIRHAKALLRGSAKTDIQKKNLTADLKMACAGEVELFFQVNKGSSWNIAIFGAGHVCQALSRILLTLNCKIYAIDSREEWLAKLPESSRIIKINKDKVEDAVAEIPNDSFVISMTHGHLYDLDILKKALDKSKNFPYVGAIGSKAKSAQVKGALQEFGIEKKRIDALYCPIGLKIGSSLPEEIAISIVSQLLEVRGK